MVFIKIYQQRIVWANWNKNASWFRSECRAIMVKCKYKFAVFQKIAAGNAGGIFGKVEIRSETAVFV